jgi:hypothetical protein
MELIYLLYKAVGKPARYILLLNLGERDGKICGLLTDAVSDGERENIMSQANRLAGLSLERKIEWLRTHIPHAFRAGYRQIHKHNTQIISTHKMGRI